MNAPNPKWNTSMDAATLDAAWKGIGERRTRARNVRRVKMAALPLLGAALIAILVVIVGRRPLQQEAPVVVASLTLQGGAPLPVVAWDSVTEPKTINFEDGSHLLLAKGAVIKALAPRDPARVEMLLEAGVVTFDIKPHGPRAWVIDAGNGTFVRVLGTRFTVTREGKHVRVAVERGKVRVESGALVQRDLVAGQDLDVGGEQPAATTPAAKGPAVPVENLAPASSVKSSSSRKPAASAPAAAAPTAEATAPPSPPSDLFADADVARKAGRPRDAVAILKTVEGDKAALAAFTIGKIHAEELHEPAIAATWFERAIRLGSLASGLEEDAYARVVESHGQAGHTEEAARAASQYEAKFGPSGRHLARVKRWTAKR